MHFRRRNNTVRTCRTQVSRRSYSLVLTILHQQIPSRGKPYADTRQSAQTWGSDNPLPPSYNIPPATGWETCPRHSSPQTTPRAEIFSPHSPPATIAPRRNCRRDTRSATPNSHSNPRPRNTSHRAAQPGIERRPTRSARTPRGAGRRCRRSPLATRRDCPSAGASRRRGRRDVAEHGGGGGIPIRRACAWRRCRGRYGRGMSDHEGRRSCSDVLPRKSSPPWMLSFSLLSMSRRRFRRLPKSVPRGTCRTGDAPCQCWILTCTPCEMAARHRPWTWTHSRDRAAGGIR
mmetsp:Transcript_37202/g.80296  ORF Transcript_37202/g.80296 Transcript_37202/m.80296 type:complete len:289 (-) Transcript_37202:2071-2937(-)